MLSHRFIDNQALGLDDYGGAISMYGQGTKVRIERSYFYGNDAHLGAAIAVYNAGPSVAVLNSVLANTSTDGVGVIYDTSGDDFAVELDTVELHSNARAALSSTGQVLAQNCIGLEPTDIVNVSVGTCATTGEFCMPEACTNAAVGTECYCWLNGEEPTTDPLPTGCMESAQLEIAVPSTLEMTLIAMKPGNASQEARVGGFPHPARSHS